MSDTNTDNRTLKDLARNALEVQSAVNLSGVVYSFADDIARLRVLLIQESPTTFSTQQLNRHHICILWINKMADLSQSEFGFTYSYAYDWCKQTAAASE